MNDHLGELATSLSMGAGAAFDRIAASYDRDFTNSHIGRAQRREVWKVLHKAFQEGDKILELNCGTGEDAFSLAELGVAVFSCDASQQMILRAEHRLRQKPSLLPIVFCHLPTERLAELNPSTPFDGAFSNFSGLNCVAELAPLSAQLARLVRPGGSLLICLSTRHCLMEVLFYLLLGEPRRAFRRWKGRTEASLQGAQLTVYYATMSELRRSFSPHFQLRYVLGVGVAIPPTYLEGWVARHPGTFDLLCRLEPIVARLPILRSTGDHVLLCFERAEQ